MSDWTEYSSYDQNYQQPPQQQQHQQQGGFYDGSTSGYDPSSGPTFMTPAPIGGDLNSGGGGGGFGAGVSSGGPDEFADEPPLLEELGINVEHILQKTLSVLNPMRATRPEVAGDSDLAGPLAFCLAFGSLLLLVGKIHFNYIYGIGAMGCLAMYSLLSMMSMEPVHFTVIVSVLGYCILPIVMLSALSIIVSLQGVLGTLCAIAAVGWCALSASNLFITAFRMEHQQLLVAYPCSLLYAVFALITMF